MWLPHLADTVWMTDDAVVRTAVGALLAAYADASGAAPDPHLPAVCADAELLNRAYRHLRGRAPGWVAGLESTLDRRAVVEAVVTP
jgi:hypothetical protein